MSTDEPFLPYDDGARQDAAPETPDGPEATDDEAPDTLAGGTPDDLAAEEADGALPEDVDPADPVDPDEKRPAFRTPTGQGLTPEQLADDGERGA